MAQSDTHHSEHHGIAHVASREVLLGTWIALMVLTVITVAATRVDLGSTLNLTLAMLIAVVKASLVCAFFMHLAFDRPFHSLIFIGALLAAALFVGYVLMDSTQYQPAIVWDPASPPAAPYGPATIAEPTVTGISQEPMAWR